LRRSAKRRREDLWKKQLGGVYGVINAAKGKAYILQLGEMLNGECTEYKKQSLNIFLKNAKCGTLFHDCACTLSSHVAASVDRCLLDGFHAKKHLCSKKMYHPDHPSNKKHAANRNTSACEQLWSRMDKLGFIRYLGRSNYRAVLRHYCLWRNRFIRLGFSTDTNPCKSRGGVRTAALKR
jgi:hypothetical protein